MMLTLVYGHAVSAYKLEGHTTLCAHVNNLGYHVRPSLHADTQTPPSPSPSCSAPSISLTRPLTEALEVQHSDTESPILVHHTMLHTYIHTYVRTYTHTYIHTYIHTFMYIHILYVDTYCATCRHIHVYCMYICSGNYLGNQVARL